MLAQRFWSWTLQLRPAHEAWSQGWVREKALLCAVFGITGTTSVCCVRPALHTAGLEGSLRDGPWSYRVASIALVSPAYSLLLVAFGTIAGRHRFFGSMSSRILGRFGPAGRGLERALCRRKHAA